MLRRLVKLGIFLLIAHALYQSVPVFLHHYQFKDAVYETALFSKDRSDVEITERLMDLAARYDIPLDPSTVEIRREKLYTYIDLSYVQPIEWVPSYRREWPFKVSVEAWGAPTR